MRVLKADMFVNSHSSHNYFDEQTRRFPESLPVNVVESKQEEYGKICHFNAFRRNRECMEVVASKEERRRFLDEPREVRIDGPLN